MTRSYSAGIHTGHLPQPREADFTSIEDAFTTVGCTPSDECRNTCEALKKFLQSYIPRRSLNLFENEIVAASECTGPVHKMLGRSACGAGLRK